MVLTDKTYKISPRIQLSWTVWWAVSCYCGLEMKAFIVVAWNAAQRNSVFLLNMDAWSRLAVTNLVAVSVSLSIEMMSQEVNQHLLHGFGHQTRVSRQNIQYSFNIHDCGWIRPTETNNCMRKMDLLSGTLKEGWIDK